VTAGDASGAVAGSPPRPKRGSSDRVFFTGIIALIAATVFAGFAHSYYLAGVVLAPLKSPVLHVHGIVFTAWILTLLLQTGLIAGRRIDLHRKLGMVGFGLACLVVVLGVCAAGNAVARHGADNDSALIPLTDIGLFALFTGLAFRFRRDPATHKRLVVLGSTALLTPALFRVPLPVIQHDLIASILATELFALALIVYDLVSLRRLERATWLGTGVMAFIQWARLLAADTKAWNAVDVWLARTF
jgi:hypothetical protein